MGFGIGATEDTEGQQETRFFSTTDNNYKYSTIASWLKENTPDIGDLVRVNVGIKNEYSGETKKGLWDRFAASTLAAHPHWCQASLNKNKQFVPQLSHIMWYYETNETDVTIKPHREKGVFFYEI